MSCFLGAACRWSPPSIMQQSVAGSNRLFPKATNCYQRTPCNDLPRVDASNDLPGGVRVHERAEEEVVDDRLETGNAYERIRTVIDIGQPIVTHILQAGS